MQTASNAPVPINLTGTVFGGALPVPGAHIYLYAAGTNGLAGPGITASTSNASTSLLLASGSNTAADANSHYYVTSGANGSFTLSGDFATCTPGQQLYLYSTGGNGGAGNNTAAGMLADIGGCTSTYPNSSTHIHIDEHTTLAAAYAVAGYATDATHISDDESVAANTTASYAKTGMANAFSTAANIDNLATGAPYATTLAGNGTIPVNTINTIANILADCVQSSGPTITPCTDLFNYTGTATTATSTYTPDTATAAILLAQNPGGVTGKTVTALKLFNDIPQNTAFTPQLTSAPADYSLAIKYTGGGMNVPFFIAVDAGGNVWTTNVGNTPSLPELSPLGAAISSSAGYTGGGLSSPYGLAIDGSGNVWATNFFANSLSEIGPTGTPVVASAYTTGGLNGPQGLTIDDYNHIWIANNSGNSYSLFNTNGTVVNSAATTGNGLASPRGVTVNTYNAYFSNLTSNVISSYQKFAQGTNANITGGGLSSALQLDTDLNGNIWAINGNNSLSAFNYATGAAISPTTGYTGGGLNNAYFLAIDGAGKVYVSNSGNNSISIFSNSGAAITGASGSIGTTSAGTTVFNQALGIAIDGSGNAWIANGSGNTMVEFLGIAAPVVTPRYQGVKANKINQRP